MSGFEQFLEIRKTYAKILPEWMDDYDATGNMHNDPYIMDWTLGFSPIESLVWADIRDMCLPFYPQMPALNYFLDFGNPFLKIGIECDGKAWHDKAKDTARDKRLAAAGWMIFRIEGHECKRTVNILGEYRDHDDPVPRADILKYFSETSQGVMRAIKRRYFDGNPVAEQDWAVDATLFNHRSTPETSPQARLLVPRDSGPMLMRDMMPAYLDLLHRRMMRGIP